MKKDPKAFFALAIVSTVWGTTYLASRIGVQYMPGLFLAGIRQLISGLIVVSFFLLKRHSLPPVKDLKKIVLQGFFLLCLSNGLMSWAVQYISSGLAAIIGALVPMFMVLFSMWMGKLRKPGIILFAGLLLGFAGIGMIFYDYLAQVIQPGFMIGIGLAFISVLSWSFGSVYSAGKIDGMHIMFVAGLQMLSAGMIMLPMSYLTGNSVDLATLNPDAWWSLSYLIVFGSLISYAAYVYVLTRLSTTQVSIYAYINPVVAVILGALILQESFSMHMILGTLITLGGIYIVNKESKKLSYEKR
jgi:drug/metabolite transporter (DMT)-like permease